MHRKHNKMHCFAQNILFVIFFLKLLRDCCLFIFCLLFNNVFSFKIRVFYE